MHPRIGGYRPGLITALLVLAVALISGSTVLVAHHSLISSTHAAAPATSGPALQGAAPGWSMLRGGPSSDGSVHNDGTVPLQLDLSHAPGVLWTQSLASSPASALLSDTAAVGPDGTLYQVDADGALVALDPVHGAVKWRSATVLGTHQISLPLRDTGSSPAVGANGMIYAGSEAGGLYQFSPTDGSNIQLTGDGTYNGSSVIIGQDGTLYAGSIDGTVQAINPDGTQHWPGGAYAVTQCPHSYTPFIQSTAALDAQGNLYIGYGCTAGGSGGFMRGGVISLKADGTLRWKFSSTGSGPFPNLQGATYGPVVLSPDGSTVYATDAGGGGQPHLFAIDAASGALKWSFAAGGQLVTAPALSADGRYLYLAVSQVQSSPEVLNPEADSPVIAFDAASGAIVNALHLSTDPTVDSNYGETAPIVDSAGNVLLFTAQRAVAYSAGLGTRLFAPFIEAQALNASFWGGLAVDGTGQIYASDNNGMLIAFSSTVNPPSPTPFPTNVPVATPVIVTDTPVPLIPTDTPVLPSPDASATALASASVTATAVAADGKLPPCQLIVLPNPRTVQEGSSVTILYKALPGTTILAEINGFLGYPRYARISSGNFDGFGFARYIISLSGFTYIPLPGLPDLAFPLAPDVSAFEFTLDSTGRALLTYSIPQTGPTGTITTQTYANQVGCQLNHKPTTDSNGHVIGNAYQAVQLAQAAEIVVEAPAPTSFNLSVKLRHNVLINSDEPNTSVAAHAPAWTSPIPAIALADAPHTTLVANNVYVKTGIGDQVNVQAYEFCKSPASPPAAHPADCGITSAFSAFGTAATPFFNVTGNAASYTQANPSTYQSSTYGLYTVAIPVVSDMLVPGKGARIGVVVTVGTAGHTQTYKTSFPIQEIRARLVIQPQETTRGDGRRMFELGHYKSNTAQNNPSNSLSFNTSKFTALISADRGASVTGTVDFGNPAAGGFRDVETGVAGSQSGRLTLRFAVPDNVQPQSGTATLTVTSTYRGAALTRTIGFSYGPKNGR